MEKIALLPGGFKPPHAGHYNAAKWLVANTDTDSVIVKVGSGVRDGISREMSLQLWTLYIQSDEDPLSNKLSVEASKNNSPVRDVYEYIENPPNSEVKIIYLGLGKKDIEGGRYKNAPKYAKKGVEVKVKEIPPQSGGVSGTEMRGFIKDNDKVSFLNSLPKHLSSDQKSQAWDIVYAATSKQEKPIDPRAMSMQLEEDLYNPEDKVLDYMRSSEYKAGRSKPDDIEPGYKYRRGGMYSGGGMGFGGMYENLEGDKSNKIFVMKSPHTPKGQKWDHIGFILNDGRLKDMSGHRGSNKSPKTYKYEDTEELFQMPKDKNEAIKKGLYAEKELPKEIIIPNNIACDIKDPNKKAENCGSFVKIVLSNNGIETTKSNWMGDIYNSINEGEKKGKTLHVYDFDDTITQVKSNIKTIITSPNDPNFFQELNIPSEDFPEKSKELESRLGHLDITYDFSEFEKQISDAIVNTGVVNKLKKSLSNPNIKTTILTARSIGHPVTRYLKNELGLEAYVVPLGLQIDGKVLGKDKADWIENHINKGYNNIFFIDDSEDNRTAVSALKDKYPDINLTVENPATVSEMMGMMNKAEKKKHAKNMKRLSKDMSGIKGNNYGGGGYKVPDYVKGTLTRKLYETKYGGYDMLEPYKDEIRMKYGSSELHNLQTLLSQNKDEEVETWLKTKGYINERELSDKEEKIVKGLKKSGFKKDDPATYAIATAKAKKMKETKLFSQEWWKQQLNEVITETKANTHLTHLEELVLTQGQDGYNQARAFLFELIKNLKGEDNTIKNVSVKWDGAPAIFAGINPDNGKFFVGIKGVFNKDPKINYTPQDIDKNHGHAGDLVDKLKLALQYLPSLGIKNILQGDLMFTSNSVETVDIGGVSHYTFEPNTIKYAVEANSEIGKQIIAAKLGIIWHTSYSDLSGGGMKFGVDISGLSKSKDVWFDDAYFKDDTGILLSAEEEKLVLEKIKKADSLNVDYDALPDEISSRVKTNLLNTYLNSEVRRGEFINDPNKSFEMFKNWYQQKVNKSIEKVKRPESKEKKKQAGEEKIKEFESKKDIVLKLFRVSKLLSEAKAIFITKYDKAVATKHFIDNGDGTLRVTKAEGFVAVDHTENGIKLVDRLEFSKNNFNAGKPGS